MSDEPNANTPAELLTGSSTVTTGTAAQQATETSTEETAEFDAAAFEVDYGMPAGSLKDAKDQASALDLIRQYTDQTLSAGLSNFTAPETSKTAETGKKAAETPAKTEAAPSGMEQVLARLDQMEARFQQAEQSQIQSQLQDMERRLVSEIDSWESPKYGKGKARTFNQLRAVKELRDLAGTQFAGYVAQGKQPPSVEVLMRQVRAFHDTDITPAKKGDTKPLGTPGASKQPSGDQSPRNIHEAYASRGW